MGVFSSRKLRRAVGAIHGLFLVALLAVVAHCAGTETDRSGDAAAPADASAESDGPELSREASRAAYAELCRHGGPPVATVLAKQFDQTCTHDDDCVTVAEGSLCNGNICNDLWCGLPPNCLTTAINRSDQSRYNAALNAAIELAKRDLGWGDRCGPLCCGSPECLLGGCGPVGCDLGCSGYTTVCQDCKCTVRVPPHIGVKVPPGNGCPIGDAGGADTGAPDASMDVGLADGTAVCPFPPPVNGTSCNPVGVMCGYGTLDGGTLTCSCEAGDAGHRWSCVTM